jgi:uncharacterized protein with NRDE domain
VHALSNGVLDTSWPKVRHAQAALQRLVTADQIGMAPLFDLLGTRDAAADSELPDTGVGLELERFLSSAFIQSEAYGTRCSTVILVGGGEVQFEERSFDPAGEPSGVVTQRFVIEAAR